MPYPTVDDLAAMLRSCGLLAEPPAPPLHELDLAGALEAVRDTFEQATGYRPFVAGTEPRSWTYYSGGERLLDLRTGLVEITEVRLAGSTVAAGTAYSTWPPGAPESGLPVDYLRWHTTPAHGARVEVTGRAGYAEALPPAVRWILLCGAAWLLYPRLALEISRGLAGMDLLDARLAFARAGQGGPLAVEAAALEREFRSGISRYRRAALE